MSNNFIAQDDSIDIAKEKIALLKTAIKYIRQDRDQLKRAGYSDISMKGFNRSILVLEEMIEEIKEGK